MIIFNNDTTIFVIVYLIAAVVTFIPVLWQLIAKVDDQIREYEVINAGLTKEVEKILIPKVMRDQEAITYWKKYIMFYKYFNYYTIIWVTSIGLMIPILTQYVDADIKIVILKGVITTISLHSTFILTFSKVLKIESNYNTYRIAASDYRTSFNKVLDSAIGNLTAEKAAFEVFVKETQNIRKAVTSKEVSNIPKLEK